MAMNTPVEQVNRILDIINAAHGTEFKLLSRFSTGEWGAYRIAQPGGQSAVLKFVTDLRDMNIFAPNPHLPGRITDRLRTLGYPKPGISWRVGCTKRACTGSKSSSLASPCGLTRRWNKSSN